MSKRQLSVKTSVHGLAGKNPSEPQPELRSSRRPIHHLGRATSWASALALAFAFLAPKPAAAVPFWEDLTTTKFPTPDPICITTSQNGCYTSWLVTTDLDNDGDMDILYANGGGYYRPDFKALQGDVPPPRSQEPSTVYLNDGLGNFTDVTTTMFLGAKSRLRQVGVADVNGDGLKDVYQPGSYAVAIAALPLVQQQPADLDKLWIQTAPGVFEDRAATLLPPGAASNTPAFHFGDLDGDGDMDLVTTDWYSASNSTPVFLSLYLNDGTGKFTLEEEEQDPQDWLKSDHFPPTIPFTAGGNNTPYWGTRAIDVDFADVDNDFDLDILVDMRNGMSRIFLNDGKAHFKDGTADTRFIVDPVTGTQKTFSNYPAKAGPYVYNQELCDFDNDGDLDMFLDNAGPKPTGLTGNFTQVLVNNGKGQFTDETRARIFGETGSDDNAVKCVDVNNDGYYDLLVASLAGASEKLLLADGTGKFNMVADAFPKINDSTLGIDAADFDGDGLMDVVTGQGENRAFFEDRYYHGVASPDGLGAVADNKAPLFRAIEKPVAVEGQPIVMRMAVRDAVTSETGDMVKDVSVVYSTPFGANGKVKATFIGGDLFRVVIPAQDAYTTINVAPQATDRGGRKGFGTPVSITVKAKPVVIPPDPDGEGGEGGMGGVGGEPPIAEGGAGGEPVVSPGGTAGGGTGGTGGTETGGTSAGGTDATSGTGGTEMPGAAGMEGEPEPGDGGEPATSAGTSTGASSGSGTTSAAGEGGAPSSGGTSTTPPSSGSKDDDGCSVSSSATPTSGSGWLAALGLALVFGRRRRTDRGA